MKNRRNLQSPFRTLSDSEQDLIKAGGSPSTVNNAASQRQDTGVNLLGKGGSPKRRAAKENIDVAAPSRPRSASTRTFSGSPAGSREIELPPPPQRSYSLTQRSGAQRPVKSAVQAAAGAVKPSSPRNNAVGPRSRDLPSREAD